MIGLGEGAGDEGGSMPDATDELGGSETSGSPRFDSEAKSDELEALRREVEQLRVLASTGNAEARSRAEQLYRFAQVAVAAEDVEQVFEAALDAIEYGLGTNRASILLFDAEGVMRFRAWRGLSDEYRRAVEGHSPWPRDAVAPKPILVEDVESDPGMTSYVPVFRAEGIGAVGFIPLVTGARLLGKFMVYYGQAHRYSLHEVQLATSIGNHLASVIARFAALSELRETIRYNEIFAGILAHDLRNPLGAIISAAHLLVRLRGGEGDLGVTLLSRILTSCGRMKRMIEQLLDFTQARAGGGIDIHVREANLADLCSQAVAELAVACPEWNLRQEMDGNLIGTWDPEALLRVISNLVSNAAQHGILSSPVLIKLDGTSPDSVTFEVHNEGSIPQRLLPGLFSPFRSARHTRDQSRGLGLGLFIVKEIVRAHAGTVHVASTGAAGTTFTIRLPRQVSPSPSMRAGEIATRLP